MPKPPDPKAKHPQYVMGIKQEWLIEFNAMREICARSGIHLNQEIYNRAVKSFLRDHNWPPGNSQTQLQSFGFQTRITQRCESPNCVKAAEYECNTTGKYAKPKIFYCKTHMEQTKKLGATKNARKL